MFFWAVEAVFSLNVSYVSDLSTCSDSWLVSHVSGNGTRPLLSLACSHRQAPEAGSAPGWRGGGLAPGAQTAVKEPGSLPNHGVQWGAVHDDV